MRVDAISIGDNPPEDINVIIEVPIGGQPIKYELDKDSGTLYVDRFLYTSMVYPGNYGFVPHPLSEDGDPIDVLVANTRAIVPGHFFSHYKDLEPNKWVEIDKVAEADIARDMIVKAIQRSREQTERRDGNDRRD